MALLIGLVLSAQFSSLLGQDMSAFVVDVSDMGDGSIAQAKLEAGRQAASGGLPFRSFTRGEYKWFSGQYTPPELPEDKKDQFVYGLGMFSDDGCNVTVKGSQVLGRLARNQHLPDIGESFQVLPVVLAPGKAVDITVEYMNTIYTGFPDIDGLTLFLYLIPIAIAVDADRNGTIVLSGESRDTTAEATPFRFWVNSDDDKGAQGTEQVPVANPDNNDNEIGSVRDLEDFTRLWLRIGAFYDEIKNGTLKIGLKWKNTSNGPAIKIYKSADPEGSDSYLKDEQAGQDQFASDHRSALATIVDGDAAILPVTFWTDYSEQNPKRCLLFEGTAEGKGQLRITFHKSDGTEIGEGGDTWLEIKNIKKMYQRADGATAHPWENVSFEADPSEDKRNAIIFVHGWRMSPEGAGNFAETMYKRVWHRGFKGRFAAFHWDTWWHDSAGWVPYAGEVIDAYLAHYNDSEYIAWQSGEALKNFVNSLPFERKNIAAHSMGNIVTGSALLAGMNVANYALLHAAVPAACYDDDEQRIKQGLPYTHHFGLGGIFQVTVWDNLTPDDDPDLATRALAYRGRLQGVSANLTSFYLPDDQATSFAWELNNDMTKPPDGPLSANYQYDRNAQPAEKLYKYHDIPDPSRRRILRRIRGLNSETNRVDYYLSDPHEAMPYACRTWGKAAGAFEATRGSIAGTVNLQSSTFGSPNGFDTEHSAEFTWRIQQLKAFYDQLLQTLDVDFNR
jgi:hypothetical protein